MEIKFEYENNKKRIKKKKKRVTSKNL